MKISISNTQQPNTYVSKEVYRIITSETCAKFYKQDGLEPYMLVLFMPGDIVELIQEKDTK